MKSEDLNVLLVTMDPTLEGKAMAAADEFAIVNLTTVSYPDFLKGDVPQEGIDLVIFKYPPFILRKKFQLTLEMLVEKCDELYPGVFLALESVGNGGISLLKELHKDELIERFRPVGILSRSSGKKTIGQLFANANMQRAVSSSYDLTPE